MVDPAVESPKRAFALEVLRRLRQQGYVALWAGGCVRDQLLRHSPKDYDVATNATPDEIRRVFGRRKTLEIGAAFGVVTVIGPKEAGQVDVVTFRQDEQYLDGRRPERVSFSSPEEDAQRRDFTINGLFYDPLEDRVIDYVGGQEDLRRGVIRAIGDPRERFREDKLRMLRAIRFAARFGFRLEEQTRAAIVEMAAEISVVSIERITAELRMMLENARRADSVRMMLETGLSAAILPELGPCAQAGLALDRDARPCRWPWRLKLLAALEHPSFPLALCGLFLGIVSSSIAASACERLRLTNKEQGHVAWLLEHAEALWQSRHLPWPRLQRILTSPGIMDLLALHEAQAAADGRPRDPLDECRAILARPRESWDPAPLVTGDDLIRVGIPRGPVYRDLLEAVRDAQLESQVQTTEEARQFVLERWNAMQGDQAPR